MKSSTPTLTESLAGYWSSARDDDLPPETVRLAKRFLNPRCWNWIAGAGTAGHVDCARCARRRSVDIGRRFEHRWGRSERLPAREAALVNGTASHALELDDFGGCGHSGAVVIPAVCDRGRRFGQRDAHGDPSPAYRARVLEGAGGYLATSAGIPPGPRAAAGAAQILGVRSREYAYSGIAGSFTGGILGFADGGDDQTLPSGKASRTGSPPHCWHARA